MIYNIPLLLTGFRLFSSLFILPFLLVSTLRQDNFYQNLLVAGVFLLVAFTDFLDGYFARRYRQETVVGKLLDPVADKFLLLAGLISLLVIGKISYWLVIILLGREMYVMALRLVAMEKGIDVPVSSLAKLKTASQMVMITYLIIRPIHITPLFLVVDLLMIGMVVFLSIISAWQYSVGVVYQRKT